MLLTFIFFLVLNLRALLASGQRADGQYWPCNPLVNQTCTPNPGLPQSAYTIDFTKQSALPCEWTLANYETLSYGVNGAAFTFSKRYDAPQIWTNFYILFGRVSTVMQVAPGQGMISSSVLISDDFDEIDLEFSGNNFGNDFGQGQNNYFGKGITGSYDRGAWFNVSSPQTQFHTYTVDWTPTSIVWSLDGQPIRTLLAADCNNYTHQFPQTPSKIQIGIWDGGDASEGPGTAIWAGGYTNLSLAPFTMYLKSVTIENMNPATSYKYTNKSGNWTSIQIVNDHSNGGLCSGSPVTSSATSIPSSTLSSISRSLTTPPSSIQSTSSTLPLSNPMSTSSTAFFLTSATASTSIPLSKKLIFTTCPNN